MKLPIVLCIYCGIMVIKGTEQIPLPRIETKRNIVSALNSVDFW